MNAGKAYREEGQAPTQGFERLVFFLTGVLALLGAVSTTVASASKA